MTDNLEIIVEINNQKYHLENFWCWGWLPINYTISDINDFQNNKSSYSKTITLPLTDNNQKVLGFITNLYLGNGNYNPLYRTRCLVYERYYTVFEVNGIYWCWFIR
jgi:hypothetical protein